MNAAARLAEIAAALSDLGLRFLVMGGHAVRYYGVERTTLDFDLHLGIDSLDELPALLRRSPRLAGWLLGEGPSWRPEDFRRFIVGRLPDGQEERLEFWRHNHLLPPFAEAHARREEGDYGGARLPFLALPDLIHSKETERESDWQDVALLEEIQDARLLARLDRPGDAVPALAQLRSQRGYARARQTGLLDDAGVVAAAWRQVAHPIGAAFLAPGQPELEGRQLLPGAFAAALREASPGGARHLALVEAVRRWHKQNCLLADRADKQRQGCGILPP
jgi:hypothetical protein